MSPSADNDAQIVAVCDVNPEKLEVHKGKGYEIFSDSDALINSGLCDAVVIATPHYYHTTIAITAIKAGLNVLTEKPLSVHKQDCEAVIAAFEARPDKSKLFAEMFNQRTDKTYIKMRSMVQVRITPCARAAFDLRTHTAHLPRSERRARRAQARELDHHELVPYAGTQPIAHDTTAVFQTLLGCLLTRRAGCVPWRDRLTTMAVAGAQRGRGRVAAC
jgi:predicted dehydrogenase